MKCEYGCGQEAMFLTSSGKNCCSEKYQSCPGIKQKASKKLMKMHAEGRGYKFTKEDIDKDNKKRYDSAIANAFVKDSTYANDYIKPRFIKHFLDEYKCFECGIKEWNNKPIVLELEHTDGNNRNNLPENLKLLCPNCHSQTSTFRGRNINNGLVKVSDEILLDAIKESPSTRVALIKVGLSPKGANYERVKRLKEKFNL
jgi:hypothetical protein